MRRGRRQIWRTGFQFASYPAFLSHILDPLAFFVNLTLNAVSITGNFIYTDNSGSLGNYENLGELNQEGTSTVTDQIAWGRASNGTESASFSIAEGYILSAISASVPSNQSATTPQAGTFNFGINEANSFINGLKLASLTTTASESTWNFN